MRDHLHYIQYLSVDEDQDFNPDISYLRRDRIEGIGNLVWVTANDLRKAMATQAL